MSLILIAIMSSEPPDNVKQNINLWIKQEKMCQTEYIYNKLSQVMQLAEHNTEVTEIVHCYKNEISNISNKIYTHLLLLKGRDEVVGHF